MQLRLLKRDVFPLLATYIWSTMVMAPVNGHQGTAPGEEIGLIEVQLGKSATTATSGQSSFLTLLSRLDTQILSEGCGGMTSTPVCSAAGIWCQVGSFVVRSNPYCARLWEYASLCSPPQAVAVPIEFAVAAQSVQDELAPFLGKCGLQPAHRLIR